jgi:hypothetical protein
MQQFGFMYAKDLEGEEQNKSQEYFGMDLI